MEQTVKVVELEEKVNKGEVEVETVKGEMNRSDSLTKCKDG